jgi:hypothetical protein
MLDASACLPRKISGARADRQQLAAAGFGIVGIGNHAEGAKLSVVRDARHGRSGRELRLCQFRATHGLSQRDWRVLHAK